MKFVVYLFIAVLAQPLHAGIQPVAKCARAIANYGRVAGIQFQAPKDQKLLLRAARILKEPLSEARSQAVL